MLVRSFFSSLPHLSLFLLFFSSFFRLLSCGPPAYLLSLSVYAERTSFLPSSSFHESASFSRSDGPSPGAAPSPAEGELLRSPQPGNEAGGAEKEGESQVKKTCPRPVHEQACTLELSAGDKGSFQCAFPLPNAKNIAEGVYSFEGNVTPLKTLIPGASLSNESGVYTLEIPSSFTQAECFSITCSAVDSTPSQEAKGNPSREEAFQLVRYTLLFRINGGRLECLDEPDLMG